VPRLLGSGDTLAAGNALAAVEATGRDALTEMRRLLGVLRRGGERAERTPQPGYRRILALVEETRERGLPVELRVEGERRHVSPGVDLTFYRVLEDALEAAAERGATSAEVLIRFTGDQLQLQVTDDRDGGASDRLPALRERVGLYGGHLSAARLDDGSAFRLRASLPFGVAG
jgi:signal transduction histidine kinase